MAHLNLNTIVFWTAIVLVCATERGTAAQSREGADATANEPDIAPMSLDDWSYESVYDGWYADGVVGQPI
jgi:hypothetical protein